MKPTSQTARLLAVLADNRWHVSRELHERCGYMRTNSRIAELRARGHVIEGESVPGKTGTDGYRYRLIETPRLGASMEGETGGRRRLASENTEAAVAQLSTLGAEPEAGFSFPSRPAMTDGESSAGLPVANTGSAPTQSPAATNPPPVHVAAGAAQLTLEDSA